MAVNWDEAAWREMYAAPMVVADLTYGRLYFDSTIDPFPERAEWLIARYHLTADDRVLVLGAAFGYLSEQLIKRGIDSIGVDSSPWIAEQSEQACAPLMFLDIRDVAVADLPWRPTLVVSEAMLESADEHDLPALLEAARVLAQEAPVLHLVTLQLSHEAFIRRPLDWWAAQDGEADWMALTPFGMVDDG